MLRTADFLQTFVPGAGGRRFRLKWELSPKPYRFEAGKVYLVRCNVPAFFTDQYKYKCVWSIDPDGGLLFANEQYPVMYLKYLAGTTPTVAISELETEELSPRELIS